MHSQTQHKLFYMILSIPFRISLLLYFLPLSSPLKHSHTEIFYSFLHISHSQLLPIALKHLLPFILISHSHSSKVIVFTHQYQNKYNNSEKVLNEKQ